MTRHYRSRGLRAPHTLPARPRAAVAFTSGIDTRLDERHRPLRLFRLRQDHAGRAADRAPARAGQRVSVVKHAHHGFDIDQEGKDSWRHRKAGAFEVVIASDRRLAKIREFERCAPTPPCTISLPSWTTATGCWSKGFKRAALPKIEIWRAATGQPVQYPVDPQVVAVCTDSAELLPEPTQLPLLDVNDAQAVVDFPAAQRGVPLRLRPHKPAACPEASGGARLRRCARCRAASSGRRGARSRRAAACSSRA